jgi:PAS domain S-box-containing protein
VGRDLDPSQLEALAQARAEVRRLEAELGVSGAPGAVPARPDDEASWWTEVAHLSRDFLSVHASNGDYLFASPSSVLLFGWSPEQLCGTNAYAYFHPDDLARITSSHASHGDDADDGDARVRYRIRCADGGWRWVESTSHAHSTTEAVQRIVCTTRAVDEQVALEDQLQQSNDRLRRFASLTAHDIKSPLATIAGMSEMLGLTAADRLSELERKRLGQVHEAAMRLGGLVDSLLSWAQVEGGASRSEPTDLRVLAQEVLQDLQADVDRSGATVAIGTLPTVQADPAMTRLLLQNLVANALKFRHPERAPRVRIEAEQGGTDWRLAVEDDGPGVPADQQERIFELYGRTEGGAEPGQGIGLAVCARIARKQGGRIWVESEPGKGARFVVELPGARPVAIPA